jgi:hypothetical protein
MSSRTRSLKVGAAVGLVALAATHRDAHACGGGVFRIASAESESMVVGGHQVAIALSPGRTVLWDQIAYSGAPEDFAWVMPVPAGARVEVAASAWIEALDAKTTTQVSSPGVFCFDEPSGGGCGCGMKDAAGGLSGTPSERDPGVTVVHEGSVGPYQTATLKSTDPGAIGRWLTENGYRIPADIQPLLDDYTAQGRDFIALRLKPDAGIRAMRPVRVIMPGTITTFPMRMLAAGAGDTVALKVFVITEGRVQVDGFPGAEISAQDLTWDFDAHASNYEAVRKAKLSGEGGTTWLTSYATQDPFFAPTAEPSYDGGDRGQNEGLIAGAYLTQAVKNGEGSSACAGQSLSGTAGKVVDVCPPEGGQCGTAGVNEVDSRRFACEDLEDLSAALIGLHPADVWLTRFEAELPREALTRDLSLVPAAKQERAPNLITAANNVNAPECAGAAVVPSEPTAGPSLPRGPRRGLATLGIVVSALAIAIARRMSRVRPELAPART